MAEQIKSKLNRSDRLSMWNKRFPLMASCHMIWQPYWIYPKTIKNLIQNIWTDGGEM